MTKNNIRHSLAHWPEIGTPFLSAEVENTISHSSDSIKANSFILIVDDDDPYRRMIQNYLSSIGYPYKSASNAFEALDIINHENITLIISDIKMDKKDGIQFMREVLKDRRDLSFIIMTGYSPEYSYEDIINAGGSDFIEKPFSLGELKAKICRIEKEKNTQRQLQQAFMMVKNIFKNTIAALSTTLEIRDPYTAGHQFRVADLACAIAESIGFEKERIEVLCLVSMIHDIGKIGVPADILAKPGKLLKYEMDMVRYHSQTGYNILESVEFPWPIAKMVLQHHERFNGTGYPQGLVGEEILLEARIIGVADVMEAMSSHRPYRPALGLEVALEEISRNKGILYDADIVDACVSLFIDKGFKFKKGKW